MAVTQADKPYIKMAKSDVLNSTYVPGGIVDVNYLQILAKDAEAGDDFEVQDVDGETVIIDAAAATEVFSRVYVLKHPVRNLTFTVDDSDTAILMVYKKAPHGWSE